MTLIMQNKPNLPETQMNVSSFITKDYENFHLLGHRKNKAKQTQSNPISNFLLWDVVPGKLCSQNVYPIRGSLYLRPAHLRVLFRTQTSLIAQKQPSTQTLKKIGQKM